MALISELKEHIPVTDLTYLILDYHYDFCYEKKEVIHELKYKFREDSVFYSAPEYLTLKKNPIQSFIDTRIKFKPSSLKIYSAHEEYRKSYDYQLYKQEQQSKRTRVE